MRKKDFRIDSKNYEESSVKPNLKNPFGQVSIIFFGDLGLIGRTVEHRWIIVDCIYK